MHIESAAVSHQGRRTNNEDAWVDDSAHGLWAVADGMGGYEGGEVASRIAADTLRWFVARNQGDDDVTWPFAIDPERALDENLLATAVKLADREIHARRHGRLRSMGSTVAAVMVRGRDAVVAHVGDSRVYLLRGGQLSQVTRDHSLYAEMVALGMEVPPKAQFPHANVITRALGMKPPTQVDVSRLPLRPGDAVLLCTDGLVESMDDPRIAEVLSTKAAPDAARALVQEALERGTRDNVTVVVLRVAA